MQAQTHEAHMQVANAAVKQLSHIATLPEVTLGIIELVEDPNSSAQDLNELIGRDPALSARVLKVVNSAFYGLPRQIGSINRAISMLGLNAVKNIAIAASLAKLFRGGALCDRFDAKELWDHSIAVATAARLLARESRMSSGDEAFLGGLMHDIGIMVELQSDRAKLVKVFGDMQFDGNGRPLIEFRMAERSVFGADHCHFGEALCEQWKFPRSLAVACAHHHDPMACPAESRQIGSINRAISLLGLNAVKNIAIAASLAKLFRGGALCDRFDAKELWSHSIAVATAAKLLAKEARMSCGDEAFLAGLMHDIGIMVALQTDRAKLAAAYTAMQFDGDGAPRLDFRLVERHVFGADHCHFGEALCEQWKFPRSLALACGHHHDPMGAPAESRQIPWLVFVADRLATESGGYAVDIAQRGIPAEALEAIGLVPEQLATVRADLAAALDEAQATLSV